MREYDLLNVLCSHLASYHHSSAVNDLGCIASDHVNAEDSLVLLVNDDLNDSVSTLVLSDVSAAVTEADCVLFNVKTCLSYSVLSVDDIDRQMLFVILFKYCQGGQRVVKSTACASNNNYLVSASINCSLDRNLCVG